MARHAAADFDSFIQIFQLPTWCTFLQMCLVKAGKTFPYGQEYILGPRASLPFPAAQPAHDLLSRSSAQESQVVYEQVKANLGSTDTW